ncbi:MAG: YkgJ family cysteine cluster protein [Planctomycetes bacterium]|nr:YkgJ family cysteine cluster protein [Planctomycetota bacterium]
MLPPSSQQRRVCGLRLRLGGAEVHFNHTVPPGPVRVADILPALQALTDLIVESAARPGKQASCRAGCGACCRQPVPVAEAEAVQLAEMVAAMPAARRERVLRRFEAALARLARAGQLEPLRRLARTADPEARQGIGLAYLSLQIPCPFLDAESCSIHPRRPLACREYLVTSPPSHCARPELGVERVVLPVNPSRLLYRFGDGAGDDRPRWLPLVLALEWAEQGRARAARRFPGHELFERFVSRLARQGTSDL